MRAVNAIMCSTEDGIISIDNKLPIKSKIDMHRFTSLTVKSTCIMGRTTWENLYIRPLSFRDNVIVSDTLMCTGHGINSPKVKIIPRDFLLNYLTYLQKNSASNIWVIGGRHVLMSCISLINELHLSICDEVPVSENQIVQTIPTIQEFTTTYGFDIISSTSCEDHVYNILRKV